MHTQYRGQTIQNSFKVLNIFLLLFLFASHSITLNGQLGSGQSLCARHWELVSQNIAKWNLFSLQLHGTIKKRPCVPTCLVSVKLNPGSTLHLEKSAVSKAEAIDT